MAQALWNSSRNSAKGEQVLPTRLTQRRKSEGRGNKFELKIKPGPSPTKVCEICGAKDGRDPSSAHRRKVIAARRVGEGARCSCGEDRPEALIAGSSPTICAACERAAKGRTTKDDHHPFGRANNPATISVPVNDHRSVLSVAQAEWPKSTLRNTEGSPLLAGAACVRGFVDTILYLIEKGLLWLAEMLEKMDEVLVKELGPKWWANTEIEQFTPKKKPNAKS